MVDLDNFINSKLIEEVVNSASFPIFSEIGLKRYTNKESISDSLESLYTSNPKFYAVTMAQKEFIG